MKYSWLLFDADSTLLDYDHAEYLALKQTFAAYNIFFSKEIISLYKKINEALWIQYEKKEIVINELRRKRFASLFHRLNISVDITDFSATYLNALSACTHLIPGAAEVISALFHHYNLAIITNGIPEVQRARIGRSAINPYISTLIISGEIGSIKPEKKIFDAAFRTMGNPPKSEVLIIGDSLSSDMAGGASYGIDTCWYNPNKKENTTNISITYEINLLKEVYDIL